MDSHHSIVGLNPQSQDQKSHDEIKKQAMAVQQAAGLPLRKPE